MNDCIHITHNDSDAIGCALVASAYFDNFNLYNNTYFCSAYSGSEKLNELLDEVDEEKRDVPKLVIISDLSIDELTCNRLEQLQAKHSNIKLFGFDHHKTNELYKNHKWFKVVSEKFYDETVDDYVDISACKFMLNELSIRNSFVPNGYSFLFKLINTISRYDTWEWKNHPIYKDDYLEDIIQIICRFIGTDNTYKSLLEHYGYRCLSLECFNRKAVFVNDFVPQIFVDLYRYIKDNETRYLTHIDKKVKVTEMNFNNKKYNAALYVNDSDFANSVCDSIYNRYSKIDIVIVLYPQNPQISFRTNKDDIDVSEIAKIYGGGGHKAASGAKPSYEEFLDILKLYYDSDTISIYYL